MWINSDKLNFSKILPIWAVAIKDFKKSIHQLVYPMRQKEKQI